MPASLFKECKSDSEIMQLLMKLSAEGKYPRTQLNFLAAERRDELEKDKKVSLLNPVKIIIPKEDEIPTTGVIPGKHFLYKDFMQNTRIKFSEDGGIHM